MKLVSVSEMISVEKEADSIGLTYELMMENAGRGLANVIQKRYADLKSSGILGLVGSGNNGGDALVALAHLASNGWLASAYVVRHRPEDDPLIKRFQEMGGRIYLSSQDQDKYKIRTLVSENSIILDGILGTGFHLPIKPDLASLMMNIKQYIAERQPSPLIIAVDCPSGVDCDSGAAAPETISANLTVTMAAVKEGLLKFPAFSLIGELELVGIGLSDDGSLDSWNKLQKIVPEAEWISSYLPKRPLDAHKGTFGTVLVVAGSQNYTGAAWLAGQAAYRVGAGLVTLAIPESLHPALAGQFPEATWLLLPEEEGFIDRNAVDLLQENLDRATTILIGPGFGLHPSTAEFLKLFLSGKSQTSFGFISREAEINPKIMHDLPPLVIDADGLKLISRIDDWHLRIPPLSILTPHPGEMSVLTGLSIPKIQSNRLDLACKYSKLWQQVIILKGAFSVIASPDGKCAVIPVATPALARAGSGDVLAGLVAGLRAQGVEAYPSAILATYIHAQAGLRAAQALGNSASVLAGDILKYCINVLSELYQ